MIQNLQPNRWVAIAQTQKKRIIIFATAEIICVVKWLGLTVKDIDNRNIERKQND